jgi:uncharacterized membrane protein HdeD (DUF308 family)
MAMRRMPIDRGDMIAAEELVTLLRNLRKTERGAVGSWTGLAVRAAPFALPKEMLMIQTLLKNWWLLALSGALYAIYSIMNFFMQRPDGSLALRAFVHGRDTLLEMGVVALAAGASTIAAGIWNSNAGRSWLLVLNGLACSVLGLILAFWTGPLAFRTIALLIVVMAMSIGIYELASARTSKRHLAHESLLGAAGVASVGFAVAFFTLGFGWIKLDPGSPAQSSFFWMGSYFGFSAICMLGLALRRQSLSAGLQE